MDQPGGGIILSGESAGPRVDGVAVVTGASRGIGRAIARQLSLCCQVVGFARDAEQLERTGALIAADGGTFVARVVDVTVHEAVEKGMAEVADMLGGIDILVNNAAACLRGGLTDLSASVSPVVMPVQGGKSGPAAAC